MEERSSLLSLLAPFSTTERLRKFFVTVVLRPMSSDPAALVVFARLPIPGKAKTRLAKDVGDANAAEFYARMAERIFTVTSRCERISSRTVFFSERGEEDGIRRWLQGKRRTRALDPRAASWADIRLEPQAGGGDLGHIRCRACDERWRAGSDGEGCYRGVDSRRRNGGAHFCARCCQPRSASGPQRCFRHQRGGPGLRGPYPGADGREQHN